MESHVVLMTHRKSSPVLCALDEFIHYLFTTVFLFFKRGKFHAFGVVKIIVISNYMYVVHYKCIIISAHRNLPMSIIVAGRL